MSFPASAEVMNLFATSDAEIMNLGATDGNWGGLSYLVGNINQTGGPTSTCPPPAGQVCFAYASGDDRGLFRFDLSALPQYSVIDSATVSLYVGFQAFTNYATNHITSVSLYNVTSGWTETGVTYTNRPSWSMAAATSLPIPQGTGSGNNTPVNGYISGNITSLARSWYAGTTPNYGLATSDTTNSSGLLRIYAHEAAGTATDPRLQITYHIETPVAVPDSASTLLLLAGAASLLFVAAHKRRPATSQPQAR